MPIASNAFKFYTFNLEGLETIKRLDDLQNPFPAEAMEPEIGMRGSICHRPVMDDRQDRYERSLLFRRIHLVMSYGRDFRRFIYPRSRSIPPIQGIGKRGGNHLHSSFKYQEVEWVEEDNKAISGNPWT